MHRATAKRSHANPSMVYLTQTEDAAHALTEPQKMQQDRSLPESTSLTSVDMCKSQEEILKGPTPVWQTCQRRHQQACAFLQPSVFPCHPASFSASGSHRCRVAQRCTGQLSISGGPATYVEVTSLNRHLQTLGVQ